MGTNEKIEIRMQDAFPGLGAVTWSEMVWSHLIPQAELDTAPPGIRNATGGRPGHEIRMLGNICFGVPLVCGDLVETEPSRARQPIPRVTRVVALQPGILVTATGYAEISREAKDVPVGPGANDTGCGCGYCNETGLDEHWWSTCQGSLYDSGAAMAETDGDRISVFFPQTTDVTLSRADMIGRCCSAGMVRDTLRLFDLEDREVFTGLRLVGQGETEGQDAAA